MESIFRLKLRPKNPVGGELRSILTTPSPSPPWRAGSVDAEPPFWDNKDRAQQVSRKHHGSNQSVAFFQVNEKADDLESLTALAKEETDPAGQ